MLVEFINQKGMYLTPPPSKRGVSDTLKPHTITAGITRDYNNNLHINFGQYKQTYKGTKTFKKFTQERGEPSISDPNLTSKVHTIYYVYEQGGIL